MFTAILTDHDNDDELLVDEFVSVEEQTLFPASVIVESRGHVAKRVSLVVVYHLGTLYVACLESVQPGGRRSYDFHCFNFEG